MTPPPSSGPAVTAPRARVPRSAPEAYASRLRRAAAAPLVTYYDLATGERVELSATTWLNWAAKVAGLLTDELGLERGDRLRVDLGAHWQTGVILGGAWWAGIEVVSGRAAAGGVGDVAAVACPESEVEAYAGSGVPVLALSLKPMSGPCGPLPEGVLDFGREVLSMPDAYLPLDPPGGDDPALEAGGDTFTQADLLALPHDERVLTDHSPASRAGAALLAGAIAGEGSLVLVRGAAEVPTSLTEQEQVTRVDVGG